MCICFSLPISCNDKNSFEKHISQTFPLNDIMCVTWAAGAWPSTQQHTGIASNFPFHRLLSFAMEKNTICAHTNIQAVTCVCVWCERVASSVEQVPFDVRSVPLTIFWLSPKIRHLQCADCMRLIFQFGLTVAEKKQRRHLKTLEKIYCYGTWLKTPHETIMQCKCRETRDPRHMHIIILFTLAAYCAKRNRGQSSLRSHFNETMNFRFLWCVWLIIMRVKGAYLHLPHATHSLHLIVWAFLFVGFAPLCHWLIGTLSTRHAKRNALNSHSYSARHWQ